MSNLRRDRRRARESALALLYSSDITEDAVASIVERGAYPDDSIAVSAYAESLIEGTMLHRDEIDAQLASTSENWSLDRMPVVDRAILRIAVYEMLFVDNVPVSVAINEAVELAKLYGGEDESARFVNGVLGRIARSAERAVAIAAPAHADGDADQEDPVPDAGSGSASDTDSRELVESTAAEAEEDGARSGDE